MAGSLIFIIILFYVIKTVVKQAGMADKGNISQSRPSAAGKKNTYTAADGAGYSRKVTASPAKSAGKAEENNRMGQSGTTEDMSTMEYLNQKAMEDAREHQKEERQEEIRLQGRSGGRMTAMRYMDGDGIPKGMHPVVCGYCGAENLVADHRKQSECSCYFCREEL